MTEQLGPNSTNTSQNNTRQSLPKGENTAKSDSSLRVSETRDSNAKAELEKNSQNSAKKDIFFLIFIFHTSFIFYISI